MKIDYTDRYTSVVDRDEVSAFVVGELFDQGYEGQVEKAGANAERAQEALGRLVSIMCDKGMLTADDVVIIANSSDIETKLIKQETE